MSYYQIIMHLRYTLKVLGALETLAQPFMAGTGLFPCPKMGPWNLLALESMAAS